ncbi:MAG: tyrosine-type recombinase/integrase [Lacrimispora sphenoides]
MKERIINEILMQMEPHINTETLRILETVIIKALYYVEVQKKETELSTEMDDNLYLLQMYEMNVRKDGLSEKTIRAYMGAMRNMLCATDKNIRHITSVDIKYYLDMYAGKGNSVRTVNNERRFLSAVFTWFRKHGVINVNPVEAVPVKKERKPPIDYLKGVEIERLRVACTNPRERALMEFLLSTGVRIGEVPQLRKQDIDWSTGEIVIYAHKTSDYRTVYLNDVARVHIKKYLDSRTDTSHALFAWVKAPYKAVNEDGLRLIIKQIGDKAELKRRVYPHLFRKTMATTLRIKDCAIEDIQQILGHKDPSTTLGFYAAANGEHLRQVHNRYMSIGA